ncbi:MAG TPA: ferrous iron transporter B [Clostridia bacterium]|nr:ferrous iron transporter B [Clostridia bacterium]
MDFREEILRSAYETAERIAPSVVEGRATVPLCSWHERLDDIMTSAALGFPIMLVLLAGILWLTIRGANYPSDVLASGFSKLETFLAATLEHARAPGWLGSMLLYGIYRTTAWVVSVMLPPMAIFFPIFTLLENLGYLPRVAFNLDNLFKRVGAHGKQALTMCMGFGCNAAGVVSCRVIDCYRERLMAILTNNFIPCNGRFPLLIILATLFFGETTNVDGPTTNGPIRTAVVNARISPDGASVHSPAVITVAGLIIFGVLVTFFVSWFLARTFLRGVPSGFALEIPPYRLPQIGKILVKSLLDRTLIVLVRAVTIAAPAGAVVWILANTATSEAPGSPSLLSSAAALLEPIGRVLGMDGFILMGFLLGLPANEIVLPITLMGYLSAGTLIKVEGLQTLRLILVKQQGWTWTTALSVMLFSLLHYPCGTTLFTIWKETGSVKWTVLAAVIPLAVACTACFTFNQIVKLFL